MPRFTFGRCCSCEFLVALEKDGTAVRHFRKYQTHSHQIVRELCDGMALPSLGAPIVVKAPSLRSARAIARGEGATTSLRESRDSE